MVTWAPERAERSTWWSATGGPGSIEQVDRLLRSAAPGRVRLRAEARRRGPAAPDADWVDGRAGGSLGGDGQQALGGFAGRLHFRRGAPLRFGGAASRAADGQTEKHGGDSQVCHTQAHACVSRSALDAVNCTKQRTNVPKIVVDAPGGG